MSTRIRIAVFFSLLSTLILLIFSASIFFFFRQSWITSEKKDLQELAQNIEKKARDEWNERQEWKEFFSTKQKIRVQIRDDRGVILFSSLDMPDFTDNKQAFFWSADQKYLMHTATLFFGEALIAESVTNYRREEKLLQSVLFSLLFVSVFFLFFIGFFFAKKILSPLRKISEHTKEISLEKIKKRLPISGPKNDEIRVLSENLNAMFARLEDSAQNLKRFIQDASHELKTPLAVLDTTLQLAMYTGEKEKIHEAHQEIKSITTLLDTLLLLAKYEKKRFSDTEKVLFVFTEKIESIVQKIAIHFAHKHIRFQNTIPKETQILLHEGSWRPLFWNILWNAWKFAPPKSVISISLQNGEIHISNAGEISKENISHLFDRFFRGDASKSSEGSGLGLSIAKSFVEVNGGSIDIISENGRITVRIKNICS